METSQPVTLHAPAKYRFLGKLGEGGMAEVFVGVMDQAPGFRKLLVLKLLRDSLAQERESLTMFLDEARLAARLHHRNVVQTYEVGQVGDRYAIVMEFLEGATLGKLRRLAQGSTSPGTRPVSATLPLAETLYILCEALAGLHYAHELRDFDGSPLSFVHRDFTPANLMVTLDGQVKVLDFGVAKTRANVGQTHTGMIKGTTRYMARETVLGQPVDRRTDVYMAGVVLWHMVTGQRPWDDREDVGVLAAIIEKRLPPARSVEPSVPEQLESIILRATDPDPASRFQTAQELREALLAFAREAGLHSDPDQLAWLVRELAGSECETLRRRIDEQLSQPRPPSGTLPGVGPLTSIAPEGSASRIRPTGAHDTTLSRLRRYPVMLTAFGLLAMCAGLVVALTLTGDQVRTSSTDISLTLELPGPPQGSAPAREALSVAAAPVPAPARELPARAPEPTHERVTLRISAEPAGAALFLDGQRLPGNPAELHVARDEALHQLRVEAPGHRAKVVVTRFDRDADVSVSLRPARGTGRAPLRERKTRVSRSRSEPAPQPAPRSAPSRQPATRSIDTESPWR
jgi:serine/threonine protein kinase